MGPGFLFDSQSLGFSFQVLGLAGGVPAWGSLRVQGLGFPAPKRFGEAKLAYLDEHHAGKASPFSAGPSRSFQATLGVKVRFVSVPATANLKVALLLASQP